MKHLPPDLIDQHRDALVAGVRAVEQIESMIRQLEYLRTAQLALLTRVASAIARDEGHLDHGEHVHRAVEAEIALATRTGQTAVASRMGHAGSLLADYPSVSVAFSEGRVSLRHTEVIADAGQVIADQDARRAYEAEVLPLAATMPAAQLRAHARRLAERYAERTLDERHRDAHRRREVRVVDLEDGMAQLTAILGAVEAYAIKDRLSRVAYERRRRATAAGGAASATSRQTQADVLVELLLSAGTGSEEEPLSPDADPLKRITGRVQVTVPVLTLAGIVDAEAEPYAGPAELAGYGPIDASTARRLAGGASGWERVLTHPISGAVLAVDRYRPSEDLKRMLGARDQHCRFPGCIRRIDHCDVDHTVPASRGGPTSPENTGHLCRRHHTLKHFEFLGGGGWKAKQTTGGVYEWTAPSGRSYRSAPTSRLRFRPAPPRTGWEEPDDSGERSDDATGAGGQETST